MTLKELRELISFEAKIPIDKEIGGWLDQTIKQTARQITALVRYPELFVSDYEVELTAAQQSFVLPFDVQHLDREHFRFAVDGNVADQYGLVYRTNFNTTNTGGTRYMKRVGQTVLLYPYGDIVVGDTLLFNYWKYPLIALDEDDAPIEGYIPDDLEIEPEAIIAELQMKVIARALTFVDQKQVPLYRSLAVEQRSANLAQTDLDAVGD